MVYCGYQAKTQPSQPKPKGEKGARPLSSIPEPILINKANEMVGSFIENCLKPNILKANEPNKIPVVGFKRIRNQTDLDADTLVKHIQGALSRTQKVE